MIVFDTTLHHRTNDIEINNYLSTSDLQQSAKSIPHNISIKCPELTHVK